MDAFDHILGNNLQYTQAVAESGVFEALLDCNIVYKGKYTSEIRLCHEPVSRPVVTEWLENLRKEMNQYDKFMYWLFKKTKGLKQGQKVVQMTS